MVLTAFVVPERNNKKHKKIDEKSLTIFLNIIF